MSKVLAINPSLVALDCLNRIQDEVDRLAIPVHEREHLVSLIRHHKRLVIETVRHPELIAGPPPLSPRPSFDKTADRPDCCICAVAGSCAEAEAL